MNVTSASASALLPSSRSAGTSSAVAGRSESGSVPGGAESEFLKYARMSPMERMRASILKGMDLTEDQLAVLPQEARKKVEDAIKDQMKKMMGESDHKGQLVDLSA